jgi:hypothetical protein
MPYFEQQRLLIQRIYINQGTEYYGNNPRKQSTVAITMRYGIVK